MSDARKKMMAKINSKVKANKAYKQRAAKRMGTYGIIIEFIKAMEDVTSEAVDPIDFEDGLVRESKLMLDRMKTIDPEVNLQIVWNNEYKVEKWDELQVEGVKITWSRFWKKEHPLDPDTKYIDVAQLFLEGYLDE
jgi:hypothetical protein